MYWFWYDNLLFCSRESDRFSPWRESEKLKNGSQDCDSLQTRNLCVCVCVVFTIFSPRSGVRRIGRTSTSHVYICEGMKWIAGDFLCLTACVFAHRLHVRLLTIGDKTFSQHDTVRCNPNKFLIKASCLTSTANVFSPKCTSQANCPTYIYSPASSIPRQISNSSTCVPVNAVVVRILTTQCCCFLFFIFRQSLCMKTLQLSHKVRSGTNGNVIICRLRHLTYK